MKQKQVVVERVIDYLKNIEFFEKLTEEMDKDIRKLSKTVRKGLG